MSEYENVRHARMICLLQPSRVATCFYTPATVGGGLIWSNVKLIVNTLAKIFELINADESSAAGNVNLW